MNTGVIGAMNHGWIGLSPIETLVRRACEPSLGEPPYNLHIELAEYINTKRANTPREAAHACLQMINSRNPHTCLLALSLLQSLVAQCGYPFHLQIATKEFLNELVRRFPERPPPYPGPVMSRILEIINDWKETICTDSRWREDLGNIRDMWRLLSYKGYRFKERRREANTPSTSNLKSAEELEAEDRLAQEAKLQELIRRGTPRDLALAQDLMKILAGAEPEKKPDYREQVLNEMNKLESKVVLMNELLDSARETYLNAPPATDGSRKSEKMVKGDVYDQVSKVLVEARPKIQKLIADAGAAASGEGGDGDPESLDTFLQINDSINAVLKRYEAFKTGDWDSAEASAVPIELGGKAAVTKSDLIDLDLDFSGSAAPASGAGGPSDDLMGLFDSTASSQGGTAAQSQATAVGQKGPINLAALYGSSPSPTPSAQANMGMGSIALPSTPTPGTIGGGGGSLWSSGILSPSGGSSGSGPRSKSHSPTPAMHAGFGWDQGNGAPQNQTQPVAHFGNGASNRTGGQSAPQTTQTTISSSGNQTGQAKDPFADLAGLF